MPDPIPQSHIERELSLATSTGAVATWTMRRGRRDDSRRRFTLTLPDGTTVVYEPATLIAFCLGVRAALAADGRDDLL